MLRERTWKKQLKGFSPRYRGDGGRGQVTIEQLCKEGYLGQQEDQARDLPKAVLKDIKKAAETSTAFNTRQCHPNFKLCGHQTRH